jgi:hypothetical protein
MVSSIKMENSEMTMTVHPAAALFPLLDGAEKKAFVEDVRAHGVREPLKTWRGYLIDGRNRLMACEAIGITPFYKEMNFADEVEVIDYIISENVKRRHLDAGQRAMLGEALAPMLEKAAKLRQSEGQQKGREHRGSPLIKGKPSKGGEVNRQLGKMLNVGHDTISKARKVAKSSPELAAKVRDGKVSLNAAHHEVTGKAHKPVPLKAQDDKGRLAGVDIKGIAPETWQAFNKKAKAAGKSATVLIAELIEQNVDPQIKRTELSATAQEKLDAAIRQAKRRLELEFRDQVQVEVVQILRESSLPSIEERLKRLHKEIEQGRKRGIMDKPTFMKIWRCLHEDTVRGLNPKPDETLKRRYDEAFYLFEKLKPLLISATDEPTALPPMPTLEELLASRKKPRGPTTMTRRKA